jgi:hypothetical protein
VVGDGYATHTVGNGFVNQTGNARLTVKERVLRMDVKMNKILHNLFCFYTLLLTVISQQSSFVTMQDCCIVALYFIFSKPML